MIRRLFGPLAIISAVSVSAAFVFNGCTAQQRFIASGESLKALGDGFVATAALMETGLDNGSVTVEQYRQWKDFGEGFQLAYPHAVDLWKSARASRDAELEAQVTLILARFASDLARFRTLAPTSRPDGG